MEGCMSGQSWRLVIVLGTLAAIPLAGSPQITTTTIWPTKGWQKATPESQGLDSSVLAEMVEFVRDRHLPLHSIVVVRHGRLVLDADFYPYDGTRPHDVASATKSVTSALIGIAIDKGLIASVGARVRTLLPAAMPPAVDARRDALTVEHLLTMRSGLDCGFGNGEPELAQMRRSDDWAAFALGLPMRAQPGTQFAYCSCNNHVLSAIVSAHAGQSALAFAQKYLFEPLGIRDVIWPADSRGRTHGWGDLHLFPRDLAKIGYLYLHNGRWNDRQVVSEGWVRQSVVPRVRIREGVSYGYGWWLNTTRDPPVFEAEGRGGQRAAVVPDKDLVVVFNGGGVNTDEIAPFLFRAIRADTSLPEAPTHGARLRQALMAARLPPPIRKAAPLPALAAVVSRSAYHIDDNPLDLQRLRLIFSGTTVATASLRISDREWTIPVGLDGRYRFSATGPEGLPMAARGAWTSSEEFVLDLDTVANINHFMIDVQFAGRDIRLRINEATGELKDLIVSGRMRGSL
jgi:CubicO group peptidase (beta-lactamase class C family)